MMIMSDVRDVYGWSFAYQEAIEVGATCLEAVDAANNAIIWYHERERRWTRDDQEKRRQRQEERGRVPVGG